MKVKILVSILLLCFAAAAAGWDEKEAMEKAKAEAEAIRQEQEEKAKQGESDGYLNALAQKRRIIISYVNSAVKHNLKKAEAALQDNDFDKAFALNAESMVIVKSKSEILGDELYKKHKAAITKQYDMIVKSQKDYLENKAKERDAINKKRAITVRYIDLIVDEKVDKIKKALADNDFDRAFALNSEIMILIHREREALGGFYDKHKAVFLSQHDKIVRAKQKYSFSETGRKKAVNEYLQAARDLVKNYQYEEALVMIQKVLALDPDNDEANQQETILTDAIRWRQELGVKEKLRNLERKAENPKPSACDGCMPNPDEITYAGPNGIVFAKKYASPAHKEEAIKSACDSYMDSIYDHIIKSRFEQALKLVKIVLKYQPDNKKALALQSYLPDAIRWQKKNGLAEIAIVKQLETLVDLTALTQETTLAEAIDMIRKSVKPELKVSILWDDLEKASIKPGDTIGISGRGFNEVPLRTGLKRVLQAMAYKRAKLDYSVEEGLVTIATKKTIQKKIEKLFGTVGKKIEENATD